RLARDQNNLASEPNIDEIGAIELHAHSSVDSKTRSITHPRANGSEIAGSKPLKQTGYQQASDQPRCRGEWHP
ncbi:MAG: hypothetical protein ACK5TC_03995, partial [bacterium]